MSKKTEALLQRALAAGGKPLIVQPKRSGKTWAATTAEVWCDTTVSPPATREEALAFCRLQIKRCNVNLANAKDRGDKRAVINLERKLAVHEYLYRVVSSQTEEVIECPSCRVTAVIHGQCQCCGKNW